MDPLVPAPVSVFDLGDGAAGGAVRAPVAHRGELGMDDIGTDPALGLFDPFLDLRQPLVGDAATLGRGARCTSCITSLHEPANSVVGTTR